jgi:hypothetical protein
MIKPTYWLTRQQQRRAYRLHLLKAYAPLVVVLFLVVAVALL